MFIIFRILEEWNLQNNFEKRAYFDEYFIWLLDREGSFYELDYFDVTMLRYDDGFNSLRECHFSLFTGSCCPCFS